MGGTLEPSGSSYPSQLDWRDHGVVSEVHTQGSCGACWAITAVETIESAYALQKGRLVDLSESQVILCQDSCQLCNGGWPQNAYEYVEEHGGLPAESDFGYDADFLVELTYSREGDGTDSYTTPVQQYCPDNKEHNNNNIVLYGKLKGYGYATDRCVCYTDGTGYDCQDYNEGLAIRNVASHGPATVCLEASLWQDYAGGVLTADVGCSSKFLDMNHCVQVVGYAFATTDTNEENDDQEKSHSRDDGDETGAVKEGYWIVRNQWSENWGMNGYAHVAMGANTCGILNDMTQVYMD